MNQRFNFLLKKIMIEEQVKIYRKIKGQIVIEGKVLLSDENGNKIPQGDKFTLCGCGKSKRLPFCDSSHNDSIQ